jgi:hypothetical protein
VDIKEFFEDIEIPVEYKNFVELVAINPKHERQIKKQFKFMSKEYAGCVKDLIDPVDVLKRNIDADQLKIDNMCKLHKLEIENNEATHKNELLVKQNENNMLKKDLEIEKMNR